MRIVLIVAAALVALVLVGAGGAYLALRRGDVPMAALKQRYSLEDSQYLDLGDGTVVHYRLSGVEGGRTIILLHGFMTHERTWEGWVAALAPQHRIIRLDLPAHGLTETPADYVHSTDAYAETVNRFANKLGLGPIVVVGSSMGGEVAWKLALAHPERVAALGLVAAAGWPDPLADPKNQPPAWALLRNDAIRAAVSRLDATSLYRSGLLSATTEPELVSAERVARELALTRAPGRRPILLGMVMSEYPRTFATPEALAGISAPTLIQHGGRDTIVPPDSAERFHDAIATSILQIYPEAGHLLHEEQPSRTALDFAAFLAQQAPFSPLGQPLDLSQQPSGPGAPLTPPAPRAPTLEGVY